MSTSRPKIAFFDFTGCEGCQLTAVDALQNHPELLEVVEIVQFREAMSRASDDYQVAFVEGSCSRAEDEARLKSIRSRAEILIAFGACAHLGGVNTLRAWHSAQEVRRYVYGELARFYPGEEVKPVSAVIPVDGFIPGCPIDRDEFILSVKRLLFGQLPEIPDYPVCMECKLNENICRFSGGEACLGPITRAGCNAVCLNYGSGCMGCRGPVSNPNMSGLKIAQVSAGIEEEVAKEQLEFFQSYLMREGEVYG
jgi:coenzyme F420-reducing hydrogenase gamma subunit